MFYVAVPVEVTVVHVEYMTNKGASLVLTCMALKLRFSSLSFRISSLILSAAFVGTVPVHVSSHSRQESRSTGHHTRLQTQDDSVAVNVFFSITVRAVA